MWQARRLGPRISVGWDPRLRFNSLKTSATEDTELTNTSRSMLSGILKAGAERKHMTLRCQRSVAPGIDNNSRQKTFKKHD